jgi:preprotein translocase subunit SecG
MARLRKHIKMKSFILSTAFILVCITLGYIITKPFGGDIMETVLLILAGFVVSVIIIVDALVDRQIQSIKG